LPTLIYQDIELSSWWSSSGCKPWVQLIWIEF